MVTAQQSSKTGAAASLSRALVPLQQATEKVRAVKLPSRGLWARLFDDTLSATEARLDLVTFRGRFRRLQRLIVVEAWVILGLIIMLIVAAPLFGTHNMYYAKLPSGKVANLTPMYMPNLTHQAVLSWVTTTVTQVMTYNFANFNQEIARNENKFLPGSWKQFVTALLEDESLTKFERQQQVLTTAPAGAAVIVSEGVEDERYQWVVQLPVIMTYATNNNRSTVRRQVIELTVVRVSTLENPDGIAIKVWDSKNNASGRGGLF